MPIIPDDRQQYALDKVVDYAAFEEDDASFKDKLKAAFRLENTVISAISQEKGLPDGFADAEYDVFSKLSENEKLNDGFVKVAALSDNDDELESVRRQYQKETKSREMLGGVDGFAAMLLAGTADPINLIPVGGAAAKAYKAGNILKGGLMTGAAAVGTASATELALHATQLTRTGEESLMNVTGAMLLGGALGSGAASLNKAQLFKAAKEIEDVFDGPMTPNVSRDSDSVGAAAVFGDVRVKGEYVEAALKSLKSIDPLARVMTSGSNLARKYGALLFENPLEIKGFTGRSVEQVATTKRQAYFGRAITAHLDAFTEAKKNGFKGKRSEFNILVSKEQANPGSAGNQYARKSAAAWEKEVYGPIAKELQDLNMLGEDLDVKTAQKYLNRRWNKNKVGGDIKGFTSKVSAWLKETQPDIEDADELADVIAMRIMGTPDGMIRYNESFATSKRAKGADDLIDAEIDAERLKGIQVDEKVRVKETGEIKKVKADAADVYDRLSKQKNMLSKIRECLSA